MSLDSNKKTLDRFLKKLTKDFRNDPERDHIVENIKRLQEMFGPKTEEDREAA